MKRSGSLVRRTPLERKTGLTARGPWERKPPRSMRAPAPRRTGPVRSTVQVVRSRDDHKCVLAGVLGDECVRGLSTQHRVARGRGGSSEAFVNDPELLVTLCGDGTSGHHGWVERHRVAAELLGLLVRRARTAEATRERALAAPVMVRGQWKRAQGTQWRIALPPDVFRGRMFADVMAEVLR